MGFDKAAFGESVYQLRVRQHMSQAELAERSGLNLATVSQYEDGAFTPGADKLCSLAEALGCTPNDLIGWGRGD